MMFFLLFNTVAMGSFFKFLLLVKKPVTTFCCYVTPAGLHIISPGCARGFASLNNNNHRVVE